MDNLCIYEQARHCPTEALKDIVGGKLKGKSDINPMWRIRKLTELFGPAGIGWRASIVKEWTQEGAGGEVAAFVDIELYIKQNGKWSEAIPGTGGSMLISTEKGKLVTNDEAFKMAYTDAISVACKALGFAADVYWQQGKTKYSSNFEQEDNPVPEAPSLLGAAQSWLGRVGYTDLHAIRIIEKKTGEHVDRLGDATDAGLSEVVKYCMQVEKKRSEEESQ